MPSIVNSRWFSSAIGSNPNSIPLTWTPTAGNYLVVMLAVRNGFFANAVKDGSSGGSAYTALQVFGNPAVSSDGVGAWYRVADGTETALYLDLPSGSGSNTPETAIVEVSGVASITSALGTTGSGTAMAGPAVTPTAGAGAVVMGIFAQGTDSNVTQGAGTGWTRLYSTDVDNPSGLGFHPHVDVVYKSVPAASGSYSPAGTSSSSTGNYAISVALSGGGPAPGVWADWDGDGGFGNASSNVTDYATGWRITRGASAQVTGGGQPGQASLTLKNPQATDLFNPFYASGSLYGKLRDGVAVWVGVDDSGTFSGTAVHGLFGGRIVDVTPVPVGGATRSPTVELTLEDDLARLGRVQVSIPASRTRSHHDLRLAVLGSAAVTSYTLPPEIGTMPLSGAQGAAAPILDELNRATGTRHFAQPADTPATLSTYTARDRMWHLAGVAQGTVVAGTQHATGTDGWRKAADTVVNQQRVSFTPVEFTPGAVEVWRSPTLPLSVSGTAVYWATFDDYTDNATLAVNYTGTVASSIYSFGTTAKVQLVATGTATVTSLSVFGNLARRAPMMTAQSDNLTSQADPRGVRSGPDISSDMVGTIDSANGLAGHMTWRYGSPQARPTLTVENWFPQMFDIDLFDVLAVTVSELQVSARLFEVVGLTLECDLAASTGAHHTATYVLQECAVQTATSWFQTDVSVADGTDILGY